MLESFKGRLAKMLRLNSSGSAECITEEIIEMVKEGHEHGVLKAYEANMIENILEFADLEAQDVMIHRLNITGIDGTTNLRDALAFMLSDNHSRFPVYHENIDNIVGLIYLKDAMRFHTKKEYDDWMIKDIPGLLRKAVFIPETRNLSMLITNMQTRKLQMVIVADEYGQTAGLVTMEDILERIVGKIQDEYDEDEKQIEQLAGGDYIISGLTPLDEVRKALETELEEAEFETLNGYLIAKLDKIPSEDDRSEIISDGYSFRILGVENKTIARVRAHRLPPEEQSGEQI